MHDNDATGQKSIGNTAKALRARGTNELVLNLFGRREFEGFKNGKQTTVLDIEVWCECLKTLDLAVGLGFFGHPDEVVPKNAELFNEAAKYERRILRE